MRKPVPLRVFIIGYNRKGCTFQQPSCLRQAPKLKLLDMKGREEAPLLTAWIIFTLGGSWQI